MPGLPPLLTAWVIIFFNQYKSHQRPKPLYNIVEEPKYNNILCFSECGIELHVRAKPTIEDTKKGVKREGGSALIFYRGEAGVKVCFLTKQVNILPI